MVLESLLSNLSTMKVSRKKKKFMYVWTWDGGSWRKKQGETMADRESCGYMLDIINWMVQDEGKAAPKLCQTALTFGAKAYSPNGINKIGPNKRTWRKMLLQRLKKQIRMKHFMYFCTFWVFFWWNLMKRFRNKGFRSFIRCRKVEKFLKISLCYSCASTHSWTHGTKIGVKSKIVIHIWFPLWYQRAWASEQVGDAVIKPTLLMMSFSLLHWWGKV